MMFVFPTFSPLAAGGNLHLITAAFYEYVNAAGYFDTNFRTLVGDPGPTLGAFSPSVYDGRVVGGITSFVDGLSVAISDAPDDLFDAIEVVFNGTFSLISQINLNQASDGSFVWECPGLTDMVDGGSYTVEFRAAPVFSPSYSTPWPASSFPVSLTTSNSPQAGWSISGPADVARATVSGGVGKHPSSSDNNVIRLTGSDFGSVVLGSPAVSPGSANFIVAWIMEPTGDAFYNLSADVDGVEMPLWRKAFFDTLDVAGTSTLKAYVLDISNLSASSVSLYLSASAGTGVVYEISRIGLGTL